MRKATSRPTTMSLNTLYKWLAPSIDAKLPKRSLRLTSNRSRATHSTLDVDAGLSG